MIDLLQGRRSIPEKYGRTWYRSRLESDWALTFDRLGLRYRFEPEGRQFGDVYYIPDFFLPASQQFVEVKGLFEPDDCRKVQALIQHLPPRARTHEECPDIPIVACMGGGEFFGWHRSDACNLPFPQFLIQRARRVVLFRCDRCRQWWFADEEWSWACQCCGHYDGNNTFTAALESPLPEFTRTWRSS